MVMGKMQFQRTLVIGLKIVSLGHLDACAGAGMKARTAPSPTGTAQRKDRRVFFGSTWRLAPLLPDAEVARKCRQAGMTSPFRQVGQIGRASCRERVCQYV